MRESLVEDEATKGGGYNANDKEDDEDVPVAVESVSMIPNGVDGGIMVWMV